MDSTLSFQLPKSVVRDMKKKYPDPFKGKSSISAFTFMRTYSRNVYDSAGRFLKNESFFDVCIRCVNGCFSLAKDQFGPQWKDEDWVIKAVEMLELFLQFKLLPSGRCLWALGTPLVHTKKLGLALFNCTYHTTKDIKTTKAEFFAYVMDVLMAGVGVGYDDEGSGKLKILVPEETPSHQNKTCIKDLTKHLKEMSENSLKKDENGIKYLDYEIKYIEEYTATHRGHFKVHTIKDTREGWVNALRKLINSYIGEDFVFIPDYTKIRAEGTPLITFGGLASGPRPLAEGIAIIRRLFEKNIGKTIDSLLIADICNIIAMIVVSGNVRRSSEIFVFKNPAMQKIKDWNNPNYTYRTMNEGWAYNSNNSFKLTDDISQEEYSKLLDEFIPQMDLNGEPGIFNQDLCRKYGRIEDGDTNADPNISGPNPCGEIGLEGTSAVASNKPGCAGGELCNLVEIIMANIGSLNEFLHVARNALFLSKMVSTVPIHWKGTDEIQKRNHRLGISQTGIIEFLASINNDYELYKTWLDTCYKMLKKEDEILSARFGLTKSIKLTTIKPSGTLSLVAGVSSGMHPVRSKYFIRRVRIAKNKKDLIEVLRKSGIEIEDDVRQAGTTVVASFPICYEKENVKTKEQFSFLEQANLYLLLQRYWSDNSVSCTLEFRPDEKDELKNFLLNRRNEIKGVAVLPVRNYTYPQLPQETITREQYLDMIKNIKPITDKMFLTKNKVEEEEIDNYCSGEYCTRE